MKLLLAALRLLAAFGLGAFLSFQVTQWRVGAAQAAANVYMVGATQAFDALDRCQNPKKGWFKQ